MDHFKLKLIAILISGFGLVATPALVYAHDGQSGSGDSNHDSSQSTSSGSGESGSGEAGSTVTKPTHEAEPAEQETEHNDTNKAETEGHHFLADLEAKHGKHTEVERKKNCQSAEHGLESKLTNIQKNAPALKAKIDAIYQKALDYQAAKNLNPTGIDQLEATANAAKATAAASVASLSGLSVNLDCTSTTVADNVATFRSAAKQVRDDLKTYKTAVKAVLTALEGASENG